MQDKYAGDVGDFGKYGLLRELFKQSGGKITLGVNWFYVTRQETDNSDGNHIAYLSRTKKDSTRFRSCSPDLYDQLRILVYQNRRSIAEIEACKFLPEGTVFYSTPIPHSGVTTTERLTQRQAWFEESLSQLERVDIVFLDPDNGIQLDSSKKGESIAVKYVFTDEIESYYRLGKSLVIYNHRDRRPREEYERKILSNREYVRFPGDVKVLRFKRVSVRDFIFLIQERHRELMNHTIAHLTSPPWDFLFEQYLIEKERAMKRRVRYWTHPSVLALAGESDPIDVILGKARSVVLDALQEGWQGPPFEPLKLAKYLRIDVVPSAEVFDARAVPMGQTRVQIEYNPNKPPNRARFSLAHELAHTLFPDCGEVARNRLRSSEMRDDDWQLELLCNIAAAEFLMPVGTGGKIDREAVTIDNVIRLQRVYEVSIEAISLRMAHLTKEPCTVFAASRPSDKPKAGYRIDYSVPSRSSPLQIPRGLRVRYVSVLSECLAIGFTAKGSERWSSLPKMDIECVGIPPYPHSRWPRIVGIARSHSSKAIKGFYTKYLHGSVLEPRGTGPRIIAHIVNDKTPNWGAGFPVALKRKWPEAQKDFREWVLSDRKRLSLGATRVTRISNDLAVVHMVAQHGYGPSKKPRVRYAALKHCLDELASIALKEAATIHMPMIGSGQAGGNWEIIADLIDEALLRRNIEVTVYILPTASPVDLGQGSLSLFSVKSQTP